MYLTTNGENFSIRWLWNLPPRRGAKEVRKYMNDKWNNIMELFNFNCPWGNMHMSQRESMPNSLSEFWFYLVLPVIGIITVYLCSREKSWGNWWRKVTKVGKSQYILKLNSNLYIFTTKRCPTKIHLIYSLWYRSTYFFVHAYNLNSFVGKRIWCTDK